LVYSTYLGGGGDDEGAGIAVDPGGNAYVTGLTDSTNFPITPGAYQTTTGGGGNWDAFVTKLNVSGSGLVYSTYLGGSGDDRGDGIAIDGSGNAYVTGGTVSVNFPTTRGAYKTTYDGTGYWNAFVSKLNPLGSGLVYSTYLGGTWDAEGSGIAIDGSGNAYVTGEAGSGFSTTPGGYQTTLGGESNAFVTKLNVSGSGLVYSTFLGGSGTDPGYGIAVDSNGNAYITGSTASGFPTTPGAYQTTFGEGNYDAFVSKLNANGSGLVYSTYLSGSLGLFRWYGGRMYLKDVQSNSCFCVPP